MLPPTSNPIEKTKQIEFYKFLIRETFMILDIEIGYRCVMCYSYFNNCICDEVKWLKNY